MNAAIGVQVVWRHRVEEWLWEGGRELGRYELCLGGVYISYPDQMENIAFSSFPLQIIEREADGRRWEEGQR